MKNIKKNIVYLFTFTCILWFLTFIPAKAAEDTTQFLHNENVIYENFMNNKSTAVVSPQCKGYPFEPNTIMTMSDVINKFKNIYYLKKNPTTDYTYVNLGNDDYQELRLVLHGLDIYEPNDDSYAVIYLKTDGSNLFISYCYEVWARSYTYVNAFNVVSSFGVEYAGDISTKDFGYLNSDGVYQDLFTTNVYQYECLDQIDGSLWQNVDYSDLTRSIMVVKHTIGDTSFCYWEPSWDVTPESIDYNALNIYLQQWANLGIIWTTKEQAEIILNDYLAFYQLNLDMVNY